MVERLAQAYNLLQQARRHDLSPVDRLRALGTVGQAVDLLFLAQPAGVQRQDLLAVVADLVRKGIELARQQIIPQLGSLRLRLVSADQLGEQQQEWLFAYFRQRIYPLLTPLAVDPGHPFPYISSDSLNFLVLLQRPGHYERLAGSLLARLKIPRHVVPRLIDVPPLAAVDSPVLYHDADWRYWVWSEDVVRFFVHELFAGMSVTGIHQFRVLRASTSVAVDKEASRSRTLRDKLAPVVQLEVQSTMPPQIVQWLATRLDAPPQVVFPCDTPRGLTNLLDLASQLEALPPPECGVWPVSRRAWPTVVKTRENHDEARSQLSGECPVAPNWLP